MMEEIYQGMPERVRIGCFWWNVIVVSEREADSTRSWGITQPEHMTIAIRNSIEDPAILANTFIHEVLHAIHFAYGLLTEQNETQPDEEAYTTLGGNGLLAFWQDNPSAVKWWADLVETSMGK